MAHVFIAASRESTPEELEDREPFVELYYGGTYFYLYPAIKQLRDATGELIDPQENAFFVSEALDSLEAFLMKAQEAARSQAPEWEQRVGVREGGKTVYQRTSRVEVLELLDGIARAVQRARVESMGVLFLGD